MRHRYALMIAAATPVVAVLVACQSTLTGNEGNFQFAYNADDRVTDFNKPIAVGAWLDIEVRDVGALRPVTLSSALSDNDAVVAVTSFADQHITVQATADGQALLSVEGRVGVGPVLTDSVNLLARTPEVLQLWHTCTDQPAAAYLANTRAWMPFDMEMGNGQPVIGYGYYPVTASDPSLSLNRTDSTQHAMALDVGSATGTYRLESNLDDTSLDIQVIAPADIDDAVEPFGVVLEDIDVGDTNAFYVLPAIGGVPVCQATAVKNVVSDTPEICTVHDTKAIDDGHGGKYELGWFAITGVAEGTCVYTVSYPAGNNGAGASAPFEVMIQP